MSTVAPKTSDIVKKLLLYKFQSYVGVIWTLMTLQGIGILFSMNGVGQAGFSMSGMRIDSILYNANMVFTFTMLWIFISAIIITTKANQLDDYTFITTRKTSNIANGLFLIVAALFGALTSMLSSALIRVIYSIFGGEGITLAVTYSVSDWLLGFWTAFFYLVFLAAAGYFIGMIFQLHVFIRTVVVILIISAFFGASISGNVVEAIFVFIFQESNVILFALKTTVSAGILFVATLLFTEKMEVRS